LYTYNGEVLNLYKAYSVFYTQLIVNNNSALYYVKRQTLSCSSVVV